MLSKDHQGRYERERGGINRNTERRIGINHNSCFDLRIEFYTMRTAIFIVFDQWTGRFLLQKGWSLGEEVEAV